MFCLALVWCVSLLICLHWMRPLSDSLPCHRDCTRLLCSALSWWSCTLLAQLWPVGAGLPLWQHLPGLVLFCCALYMAFLWCTRNLASAVLAQRSPVLLGPGAELVSRCAC